MTAFIVAIINLTIIDSAKNNKDVVSNNINILTEDRKQRILILTLYDLTNTPSIFDPRNDLHTLKVKTIIKEDDEADEKDDNKEAGAKPPPPVPDVRQPENKDKKIIREIPVLF